MSLNIIARKDYEDLQKNILNEKEQENMASLKKLPVPFYKSGFKELEELIDLNYDNVIDRKDSMFYQLKIWQDLNGDGISTSNELFELVDAGILSINLDTSLRDATDTNITIDETIEDILEFEKLVA